MDYLSDEAMPLICHKKEGRSPANLTDATEIDSADVYSTAETAASVPKDGIRNRPLGFPPNIPSELHRLANLSQLHNIGNFLP
ncbi:hypothetical protein FHG87_012999, partial [Trinorchestia longiramus]